MATVRIEGRGRIQELRLISKDYDSDELSDARERTLGTDPENADSDGDGMRDGWEVSHGFDPADPGDAVEDPDYDGLTNLEEQDNGTHPFLTDTDSDGCMDGAEVAGARDPLSQDPHGDLNADCAVNLEDSLIASQAMSGLQPEQTIYELGDVDGDGRIWLPDLVYILKKISKENSQ